MSIFSRIARPLVGAAALVVTAAAYAQSFTPAVNGHADVAIASDVHTRISAPPRTIIISPAVNGAYWIVLPAGTPAGAGTPASPAETDGTKGS